MKKPFYLAYVNPLQDLDEYRLVSLFNEGERGAYASLQWLYRFIEKRNPVGRAVKRRLLASLGSLDWSIKTKDCKGDAALKAEADAQAATLRTAYDRLKNLRAALNHLALAELRGFAHVEKIYAGAGEADPWAVTELRVVEQWFWCRDTIYGAWQYNRDARQGVYMGTPLPLRPDGRLEHFIVREVDDPANEIIAKAHVRQEASDADWDGYLQKFGIPAIIIEGPPNVPTDKEAEYKKAAQQIASDAAGYIPNGAKVHAVAAGAGSSVFKERLDYLDGQIVIAATSGKLTILSESGSGTLSGGAQKDAFDEIAQAIANNVSETMQSEFDAVELERAHPGEPCLAWFEFAPVDDKDAGQALAHAKTAKEAGYAIDAGELSEKSGYKLTPLADPGTTLSPPNETEAAAAAASAQTSVTPPATPDSPPAANDGAKLPEGAVPPAASAGSVSDAAAKALRVSPEFLAPAKSVLDELIAQAEDGELSDADLLASAEAMLAAIPSMAAQADATGIADALEQVMRNAVEETLQR